MNASGWNKAMPAFENSSKASVLAGLFVLGLCVDALALPWIQFADAESSSVCEVVNAANLELVVLASTGELAGVSGTDVVFADTFVDADGLVFYFGDPAGYIEFAVDADGFRTLWWFTDFNDVANVNEFTGEPTSTGLLPIDFGDVPCDACPFWDVPAECFDSDDDGVEDAFDLCPDTPLDLVADEDGCACEELDGDLDGINACFDLCADTPLDEIPDIDGCSCSQLDSDLDGVDDCFDLCPNTPPSVVADDDGCACEEIDGDQDGINACFDLCADTPFDEIADFDGCSCSQLDDDQDGVENCFDQCSNTSPLDAVDIDGCAIIGPGGGGGGISLNFCGSINAIVLGVMVMGLVGFRRLPRRWEA